MLTAAMMYEARIVYADTQLPYSGDVDQSAKIRGERIMSHEPAKNHSHFLEVFGSEANLSSPDSRAVVDFSEARPWQLTDNSVYEFLPEIVQQYPSGGGGGGLGGATTGPLRQGAEVLGIQGLQIIPSVTISERYDSNVFFAPAIAGLKREDYVTSVSPQLFVRNVGHAVDASLQLGTVAEKYINNPSLGYIGYNAGVNLTLDRLIQRYVRGATLRVGDAFTYTPTPPAFLGGDALTANVVGQDNASQITASDYFVRGIQLARVNTYSNTASITSTYPLTARVRLAGSYSHAIIRFGRTLVPGQQGSFFNTTAHNATFGPQMTISPRDTVSATYLFFRSENEGIGAGSFEQHGGTVAWARILAPTLTATVTGGVTLVQMQGFGQTGSTQQISYIGSATLAYNKGNLTGSFGYSAGIYPSFVVSAGPMLSQNVSISGAYRMLNNRLVVSAGANYSSNEGLENSSSVSGLSFQSYGTNAGLVYYATQTTLITLAHSYLFFEGNFGILSSTAASNDFTRTTVSLSLTQFWK